MNEECQPIIKSEQEGLMASIDCYAASTNKQIAAILVELAVARLRLGGDQENQQKAIHFLDIALKALH
jgi:hypothetical protein